MRLLVALPSHYVRVSDGVYTGGPHRYTFWKRYLEFFDEITVLARMSRSDAVDPRWPRADGDRVDFEPLPDFTGPVQYWTNRKKLGPVVRAAIDKCDAFILRTGGGAVCNLAWREIRRRGCPYAVEVTADPWDALGPGTLKSWSRPMGRRLYTRNLKNHCRHASAALYVTREALQARYPPSPAALAIGCSDVEMPADAFVSQPRRFVKPASRLVYVGTLQQFYKCPDILVQAVATCARRGVDVRLRILGDGKRRTDLEDIVASSGMSDRVALLGQVADRDTLIKELDDADVFVLPSRQEGLPRAMVEAMGRGLPCIGSVVGGMPELLAPEDMVPPGDAAALAAKISEVLADPDRLTRMSARNLEVSRGYSAAILASRRAEFYEHVKALYATQ